MKINTKEMSYEEVLKLPRLQHKKPMKPQLWLTTIVRLVCEIALRQTKFTYTTDRWEQVKDQPCYRVEPSRHRKMGKRRFFRFYR